MEQFCFVCAVMHELIAEGQRWSRFVLVVLLRTCSSLKSSDWAELFVLRCYAHAHRWRAAIERSCFVMLFCTRSSLKSSDWAGYVSCAVMQQPIAEGQRLSRYEQALCLAHDMHMIMIFQLLSHHNLQVWSPHIHLSRVMEERWICRNSCVLHTNTSPTFPEYSFLTAKDKLFRVKSWISYSFQTNNSLGE